MPINFDLMVGRAKKMTRFVIAIDVNKKRKNRVSFFFFDNEGVRVNLRVP